MRISSPILLSAVLFALVVAVLPNVAQAQDDEYVDEILAQLDAASATFYDAGYEAIVWEGGALVEGEKEYYTVSLDEGYSYALVGVCDSDCSDIDLSLFDGYDDIVVQDVAVDDAPVIEFHVTSSGEFTLDVTMFDCSAEYCYYGVALFVED